MKSKIIQKNTIIQKSDKIIDDYNNNRYNSEPKAKKFLQDFLKEKSFL